MVVAVVEVVVVAGVARKFYIGRLYLSNGQDLTGYSRQPALGILYAAKVIGQRALASSS